ncbi:MAG TPA: hypothetical protein PKZ76_07835 [Xanthomonadaceae bacterium]|nr:hypothetical protein [Xanthomonadaceae bacterium]
MAIRHITLLSAALGAAFMFSSSAQACTLNAWTVNGSIVGTPAAGGPAEALQVRRYSGLCGMRATGTGNYVQNDDPAGDQIFRQRFYVFTATAAGPAVVYQAGNGTNANEIQVSMTNGTQIAVSHRGGAAMTFATTANRWYSVETALNSTASATTGDDPIPANTLIARVGGGGSDTVNSNSTGITSGAAIDFARLGCVSGCGATNVDFEEYESTRSAGTAIGRLCRGDANGNGAINNGDRVVVTNEILEISFATGQPDCTETGVINPGDRVCITNLILAEIDCP